MNSKLHSKDGFTLLEMMITITILIFISIGIYQATTQTFKLRDILSKEGEFFNSIRMAMGIIERDVATMYSPMSLIMILTPPNTQPGTPTQPTTPPDPKDLYVMGLEGLGTANEYWGAAKDRTGLRPSRFQGSANKMSFVAASNVRIYKNSPESELNKVSYELRTGVLYKTYSPNVYEEDDKRDKFSSTLPLLDGIKKLKFSFFKKDKERWETSWDTEKEDTKNIYPDTVKIELEVDGPLGLNFEGEFQLRRENPIHGVDPST